MMKSSSYVVCVALFFILAPDKWTFICAFGRRHHQASDDPAHHVKSYPSFRPWKRYAVADDDSRESKSHCQSRTLLASLTSVAQHGASVWSNHVSHERVATSSERSKLKTKPTSLKQKSSLYISQLYKRMQKTRQDQEPLNIERSAVTNENVQASSQKQMSWLVDDESYQSRKSHWPAHFFEDTLAYIAGGAAATSAFSAVVIGTIFATVVVTIGAVTSVLFCGDEINDDAIRYVDRHDGGVDNYREFWRPTLSSRDCDLNDDLYEDASDKHAGARKDDDLYSHSAIDDFVLQELKKCFAGKPSTPVIFSPNVSGVACGIDDEQQFHHFEDNGSEVANSMPAFFDGVDSITGVVSNSVPVTRNGLECNVDAGNVHFYKPRVGTSWSVAKDDDEEQTKKVELIWHDAYTTAANTYYARKMNNNEPQRSVMPSHEMKGPDQNFDIEDTEREGAVLLSDTFRVTSSAIGLLADAVRFTGESAAAAAGGTARLVGGAVRAGGWAMGSLGSAISSEKSNGVGIVHAAHSEKERYKIRKVAGATVKLLGDAIDNVAESLLLAGSATERIAFACTGAAEGTIRLVEEFASSLSDAFAREGRKGMVSNKPSRIVMDASPVGKTIHVESKDHATEAVAEILSATIAEVPLNGQSYIRDDVDEAFFAENLSSFLLGLSTWTRQTSDYIMKDTDGVPSLAPHVLFVLACMYFASVILLSSDGHKHLGDTNKQVDRNQGDKKIDSSETRERKAIPEGITAEDADTHSTLTVDSTMEREPDANLASTGTGRILYCIISMTVRPLKLFHASFVRFYQVICGKKATVLLIHLLGWLLISQTSQNRSAIIHRKAGLAGYKSAVESIGKSFMPGSNNVESAFWFNAIISTVWRVASESAGDIEIGGLEPLLASSVSSILAKRLEESYSTPSGVAHVSLDSFTFGKSVRGSTFSHVLFSTFIYLHLLILILPKPPIIRDIEVKRADAKKANAYFALDVVMLLDDASLMLDIKPSSLEYKMVPSTKVAINSFGLQLPLDLSVQATSEYPYISFVNLSLSSIPDFSLRIVPQQESGLRGIDFGSFPLISKWVKEVINSFVEDYRSPHYISIDIPAWLMGIQDNIVKYF
ncbi:hypothetical protein ACHAW6_010921 [Cyclotella cf. meneghiniana]